MNKEKIALWCVRILGVFVLLLLVLFFSGACPQWFTGRGDLFRLSSIAQFEEIVAEPYRADETVHTAPLDSALVWWIGDSFSRVQFGHRPLPEEVSELLSEFASAREILGDGANVPRERMRVSAVDYIDLQGSPKMLFALAAARAAAGLPTPKVIVLECVERNVYANLGVNAVFDYGNVAPWNEGRGLSSKIKRIRRRAFMEATGTVDFKLRRFPPVAAIRKLTDTWRYDLYGDTHPGAQAYVQKASGVGDWHFVYMADSAGVLLDHKVDAEYEAVAKNLRNLDSLAQTFGARLLFVMPPNRELMWEKNLGDLFLRNTLPLPSCGLDQMGCRHYFDFYDMLDSADIPNVDLSKEFFDLRMAGVDLYWKTDSHWNGNAHQAASRMIAAKIREMLGFASSETKKRVFPPEAKKLP